MGSTIQLIRSAKHSTPRDAAWSAIRSLRNFTLGELSHATRQSDSVLGNYLLALIRAGYVSQSPDKRKTPLSGGRAGFVYTLVRDTGVDTPRINRTGVPQRRGEVSAALWRTIKILGSFDAHELAIASSSAARTVSPATAKKYVSCLRAAGYLQQIGSARNGSAARYRLVPQRWTGPHTPRIRRGTNEVFDPNVGKIVSRHTWSETK